MSAVLQTVAGGVATLTLNRPESRNALNLEMCEQLISIAREISLNKEIKMVLVRANGHVFCAGADLKERQGMSEAQVRERRMKGFAAYAALEALPMPAIAVVQGPAVGSGCEIAGACDFIVATPQASFRTPEALRGSVGATQRLPRILGKRLAKDLMFTGRTLSAEEARQAGLVSRLVSAPELEEVLSGTPDPCALPSAASIAESSSTLRALWIRKSPRSRSNSLAAAGWASSDLAA